MKSYLLLLFIPFIFSTSCFAQSEPKLLSSQTSLQREYDLVISFQNNYSTKNIHLTLRYVKERQIVLFDISLDRKKVVKDSAQTPMSITFLRNSLNVTLDSLLKNTSSATDIRISESSLQTIYFLMYSLKNIDDQTPIAGTLRIKSIVKIYKDLDEAMLRSIGKRDAMESAVSTIETDAANIKAQFQLASDRIRDLNTKYSDEKNGFGLWSKYINSYDPQDTVLNAENAKIFSQIIKERARVMKTYSGEFINSLLQEIPNLTPQKFGSGFKDFIKDGNTKILLAVKDTFELTRKYKKALSILEQDTSSIRRIKNITLKFEGGFIEDIHVGVELGNGRADYYDNIYPIGFSSLGDIRQQSKIYLFNRKDGDERCIVLSDVIGNYNLHQELQTRDFSPADTVFNDLIPDENLVITLKRERNIHLFDSRIYTDLAGLDDKAPNGLLQVELSRRLNFNTRRHPDRRIRADYGWFNYVTIIGGLTKIEDKLKRLPMRNAYKVESGRITSPSYVTNLDLRRYENASVGIDVTALLFSYKQIKSVFRYDFGVRYGHTPILDTLLFLDSDNNLVRPLAGSATDLDAHTITFTPVRLVWKLISQRRLGIGLSYQQNNTRLLGNSRFKQIASAGKSDLEARFLERRARISHIVEFNGQVLTSKLEEDYIFFRARFFFQKGDGNEFFPQFQIGYNYNIMFKK